MKPTRLRVLVFQEGDWLCAQCLEYDLGAQARNLEGLLADLERTILGHMAICVENNLKPFSMLRRAPKKYWDLFRRSKICLPPQTFGFKVSRRAVTLPRPEIRVAPLAA
jgi:hypothetical protein